MSRIRAALVATLLVVFVAGTAPVAQGAPDPTLDASPDLPPEQLEMRRSLLEEAASKARVRAALKTAAQALPPALEAYDVLHYDLDLELDPSLHQMAGTVICRAEVVQGPLAALELQLTSNLTVTGATVDGNAAAFTHAADLVSVDLGSARGPGDTVEVGVTYQGDPGGSAFGWSSYGGQPLIWTLSEPYGAPTWWPCKDTPADKADTVDLRVTVPDGLVVASNGILVSQVLDAGRRTFHWRESYPIATYLVSLAIHPYAVIEDEWIYAPGDTMPVTHYVVPDQLVTATSGFAVTVPMLQAFSEGFGLYPFVEEKYGHAHFPWGGGMEHQTLTSLRYGAYGAWLIAHEMAHQWWGDLVTCEDFHHIWLNEGFASWCQAYWRERSEGMTGYRAEMSAMAYYGPGTVYVEDATDEAAIFDGNLSYFKGAWVVHMLRGVLGDEDFFASLQAWRSQHAYASGTTEDFQAVCEQVSQRDLSWYFQEWVYGQYYPRYEYTWYGIDRGDSTELRLSVTQTQTSQVFTMPLEIEVQTDQGPVRATFWNDEATEAYDLTVAGTLLGVTLDPDDWILNTAVARSTATPPSAAAGIRLLPSHPNPFNPSTTIPFILDRRTPVLLTVHDMAGRRVRTLAADTLGSGRHEVTWDGRDTRGRRVTSGVYFARLETAETVLGRKLVLAK
jgi:aminopeptidase N